MRREGFGGLKTLEGINFIILSVQFSGIKYINIIVQSLSLFILRTFSSFQTKALYPLNNNFHSPLLAAPGEHSSTFYLCEFDYFSYLFLSEIG